MDDSIAIPLIIASAITAVSVCHIVSRAVTRGVRHWREVTLKIRLLEAHMSADEIVRIVNAGRGKPDSREASPKREKPSKPAPVWSN